MLYMVTFTINMPQMLAYIPYMDPILWDRPKNSSCYRNGRSRSLRDALYEGWSLCLRNGPSGSRKACVTCSIQLITIDQWEFQDPCTI